MELDPRPASKIAAAIAGDRAAMEEVLADIMPRLRALVRLRMDSALRRREASEDVVQSACREAIAHLERCEYRSDAQFLSWLFTTTLNKLREKQRFWARARRHHSQEDAMRTDGPLELGYASLLT